MSNLLKSKTFKVGGLVIAVAMMLAVGAVSVSAQTTTTVVASGYTYSGVMKQGMSGPGISTLQAALNEVNVSPTIVVDGKFGPATLAAVKKFQMNHGLVADGVVGPKTGAALAAATVAVITVPTGNLPAGCTSTSGFSTTSGVRCDSGSTLPAGCTSTSGFSPTTGARCNGGSSSNLPAGCTSTSGFSSTTGVRCDGGSTGSDGSLSGGETSIDSVNVNDADDDSINEGDNEAPVAQVEFDVNDADAELLRADIVFQAENGADEEDPWQVFDKVFLLDAQGDVISSIDSDDEDVWEDADDIITGGTNQASRIRFNNVNESYSEGDSAEFWVAVDVASSVDGADLGADWTVGLEEDGLRFVDGADLTTEADAGTDTASFSIEEAGAQSEFSVTKDESSPDAQTLEVKPNASSTHTVAIFNVDTDEDGGDVKLNDFPITLTLGSTGGKFMADVVDDVMVVVDGTEYSADQSPSASLTTQEFTFDDIDDDDVVIDAGDDTNVSVKVKFNSQGSGTLNYPNGVTVTASVTGDDGDVEDADTGDDVGDVDFTATAETMTLAGSGIMVEVNSATTTITPTDDAVANNDGATFTWDLDITAFGDDLYVNRDFAKIVAAANAAACTAADGGANANVDDCYNVEVSTGATLAAVSGTITDTSDADEVVGSTGYTGSPYSGDFFWRISEGDTESFTITVTGTNQTQAKQVRAFLTGIEFTTDQVDSATPIVAATVQIYSANLAEDSQTPFKQIQ